MLRSTRGERYALAGCLAWLVSTNAFAGDPPPKTKGMEHWLFGDTPGEYQTEAFLIDVAGALGSAYIIAQVWTGDSATHPYWWGMTFGAVPSCFAGPFLHLAFGRPLPAIISALGWMSVSATSFVLGAELYKTDPTSGWAAGITTALAGGVLMTILDIYMARSHHAK